MSSMRINKIVIDQESWEEAMNEIEILRRSLDAKNKRVEELNYEKLDLIDTINSKLGIIKGLKKSIKILSKSLRT
jgi:hypothetical protein